MKYEELPRDDLPSDGGFDVGTADGGELKSLLLEPINESLLDHLHNSMMSTQ